MAPALLAVRPIFSEGAAAGHKGFENFARPNRRFSFSAKLTRKLVGTFKVENFMELVSGALDGVAGSVRYRRLSPSKIDRHAGGHKPA
jgi:hypothetical protein